MVLDIINAKAENIFSSYDWWRLLSLNVWDNVTDDWDLVVVGTSVLFPEWQRACLSKFMNHFRILALQHFEAEWTIQRSILSCIMLLNSTDVNDISQGCQWSFVWAYDTVVRLLNSVDADGNWNYWLNRECKRIREIMEGLKSSVEIDKGSVLGRVARFVSSTNRKSMYLSVKSAQHIFHLKFKVPMFHSIEKTMEVKGVIVPDEFLIHHVSFAKLTWAVMCDKNVPIFVLIGFVFIELVL